MVRVGGGWDTLERYFDKHDPCKVTGENRPKMARGYTRKRGRLPGTALGNNPIPIYKLLKLKTNRGLTSRRQPPRHFWWSLEGGPTVVHQHA